MSNFEQQAAKIRNQPGFIAALDQSGGSTPKALKLYGIGEDAYSNDDEMFTVMHEMRTRIITSPSFNGDRILGAILFENTMDRQIEGRDSADYLWSVKNVVPFLKVDKGLADEVDGAQVMKPMEVLLSATKVNAELFRMSDRIGTVEPGKYADLIVVEGDPLRNLRVFQRPENPRLVMKGGKIYKSTLA